jgi:hypothetical protein
VSAGAEIALRRAGFAALLDGRALTVAELAVAAAISEVAAAAAAGRLVAAGRATVTPEGRVDGIAGLTLRPTRHSIARMGAPRLQTWCAFDAVAIPAALAWSATALTTCAACGAAVNVPLEDGLPAGPAWGWLPPAECAHVLREFCASADLFCVRSHLDTWRASAGNPPGGAQPVAVLADLGRSAWADCLPVGGYP